MKQIGLALTTYAQDYDETFPFSRAYGPGYNVGMPVLLGPYIQRVMNNVGGEGGNNNTANIWKCPSDDTYPMTSASQGTPGAGVVLAK